VKKTFVLLLALVVNHAVVYASPLNTYSTFGGVGALGPDALRCIGTSATNPCSNATQTLTYDVNGSASTAQSAAGIVNYQYNHDNKLLRSTSSNHTTENIYGPHGERVATIEDGNTTFFFDNGLEVGSQGKSQSYFFGGERVAMKDQGQDTRFFLSDHLNSVRAVTDSHGTVLTRSDYYPFGEAMNQSGISYFNSNYKFNGNHSDPDGVYDYNARSMNPVVARFLQPDSIIPDDKDPQSLNRYAYVENNPMRFRDPSGHTKNDAIFFYANYTEHYEQPAKWSALKSASEAAKAWEAKHGKGTSRVVGITTLAELKKTLNQAKDKKQTFGMVAAFGHYGAVDGMRVSGTYQNWKDLSEDTQADIMKITGYRIEDAWIKQPQFGVFSVRAIEVEDMVTGESATIQGRFDIPADKLKGLEATSPPFSELKSTMESGGTLCFAGCSSSGMAEKYSQMTGLRAIGFDPHVSLEREALSGVIGYIKTGQLSSIMRSYSPTNTR